MGTIAAGQTLILGEVEVTRIIEYEGNTRARATRRRILVKAAAERRIVFPAHFRGPHPAMTLERAGTGFTVGSWIEFPSGKPA